MSPAPHRAIIALSAALLLLSSGCDDEPSTGLHASDVAQLVEVLQRLAERGDAVLVIEHHTGLLGACDRLVELGPAGGAAGGTIIAEGTPAELVANKASVTGPWLELDRPKTRRKPTRRAKRRRGSDSEVHT